MQHVLVFFNLALLNVFDGLGKGNKRLVGVILGELLELLLQFKDVVLRVPLLELSQNLVCLINEDLVLAILPIQQVLVSIILIH